MVDSIENKHGFIKNVLHLASGSLIAQIILILASPLLTRLYTPEQFAALALFTAATSLLYVASTGRYELALMIPEKEEDAANLLVLSMALPLIFSVITCLVLVFYDIQYLEKFGIENVDSWVYILPLSIVLYAWNVTLLRWNSRKKLFKRMAGAKIAYGATNVFGQVGLGYALEPTRALYLIAGQLFAYGVSIIMYARKAVSDIIIHRANISLNKQWALAKQFYHFPLFLGPSGIINFSASEMPTFLLLYYYSPEVTGFYALGSRVLLAPMTFIGDAVGEVFFQRVTSSRQGRNEENRQLLLLVWRNLLILVAAPALVLYVYGSDIFSFVFGAEWTKSGEYATLLAPMLALRFIVWPTRLMLQATASQVISFLWFSGYLIITIAVFVWTSDKNDPMTTIGYYSMAASAMYIIYAILTYFNSDRRSEYNDKRSVLSPGNG